MGMLPQHWFMLVVVAAVFYFVGTKYPQAAQAVGL